MEWINSSLVQERYSRYGGDRSWKKGLDYYALSNKKEAFITLGYVLHVLEDMSVPEHTRNDTHAPLGEALGDEGSPFEDYLTKWNRNSIKELNIPADLKNGGSMPPAFSSIGEYLISLAEYSNKYFFSKDTISGRYEFPKITREDDVFGYGIDQSGIEYPLAVYKKVTSPNSIGVLVNEYSIENKARYYPVLDAYFSRLSRKAVL